MKKEKSVEDYLKELDQMEAAEKLDIDEPEFKGRTLDFVKWKKYQQIKTALEGLLETSQFVRTIRGRSSPDPAEQDATVSVGVSKLAAFTEQETAVLADAMTKADLFSFTALEDSVFLNFTFKNIWID